MLPSETAIAKVQSETGMDRMQAINHLRQRADLQLVSQRLAREGRMVRVDVPADWQMPEPIEPMQHKPRWCPSLLALGAVAAVYLLGLLAYSLAHLF